MVNIGEDRDGLLRSRYLGRHATLFFMRCVTIQMKAAKETEIVRDEAPLNFILESFLKDVLCK